MIYIYYKKLNSSGDEIANVNFYAVAPRGAFTTGAAGAATPLALVVRGRTGAEKCPLLQYKSYYTSKEQV